MKPGLPELKMAVMNHTEAESDNSINRTGMVMSGMNDAGQAAGEIQMKNKGMEKMAGHTPKKDAPAPMLKEVSHYLSGLLDAYLTIGNKLANDQTDGIAASADAISKFIDLLSKTTLTDAPHFWHTNSDLVATIKEQAEMLAMGHPLAMARLTYSKMSDAIEIILAETGVPPKFDNIYSFVCPMYKKGTTAVWIQVGEKPQNPFQGQKMLTCSSQKTLIPPAGSLSHEGGK